MADTTGPGSAPVTDAPLGPAPLPPKLVQDAADRLAYLSLVIAIVIVGVQIFQRLSQPMLVPVLSDNANKLASLAAVLISLGVFAAHRYRVVTWTGVLALGMIMEIAVSFCISMIETTIPVRNDAPVIGISALGPWILVVGVFIPNRPVWTLLTGLTAATTFVIAYAINSARFHFPPMPIGTLLVWPFFNYLMAVLAFLFGRRTYGMMIAAHNAVELGSYRLVSRIGEGGMGEVWKASHQMLARAAAIKLVRPSATARQSEMAVRRFKREANVIASLQSPHTVYLYDFGISEDGRFYYVMELLDGISLQTLISTFGPQPAGRVLSILRHACRSLAEAHQQGLVHRDLKPSNLMLCKVALRYDFVKVLDFGLAKCLETEEQTQITLEGTTTGTPGYMAPEVALGNPQIDGRADVYALGCVAYFLLTGTMVFQDSNPMTMALKHVQSPPEPPSLRTELAIPEELERIVMSCLAKNPDERPSGAWELQRQFAACATPIWTEAEAEAWWQKHLPSTSSMRSFAQQATATPPVVRKI